MSPVIVPKSDQINADDLIAGPMTITIRDVQIRGGQEQPVSIFFDGSEKAYRPCKSMSRVLVQGWGADAKLYIGRSLTLYRDPTVKWAGMEVGGIRISHMSHIDGVKQMMLTATKGSRKPHKVLPLVDAPASSSSSSDDPALKWANAYIAKLATLDTIEAVDAFEKEKAKKLGELEAARPDLHSKVNAALEARKVALRPSTDSFADDDLTTGDAGPDDEEGTPGEPDPQTNDQADTPVEKSSAEKAVEDVMTRLDAAKDSKTVKAIEKEIAPHRTFLPDHLDAVIETCLEKAHKRVAEAEKVNA